MTAIGPGQRLTLSATDLDDEGAGVAEIAEVGGTPVLVHVAGALPGERVAAVVEHRSSHRPEAWARLEAVEEAAPTRRTPACPAGNACGGCTLQHLAYEAQLVWKRARVARALRRHEALSGVPVEAAIASPRPLGYRNKSKLVPGWVAGRLVLGAYAPRSHEVVDVAGCRIPEPPLDGVAGALRSRFEEAGLRPYDERTMTGDLRHVILRSNHRGEVLAVWVSRRGLPDGEALAAAFISARPEVIGVVEHVNRARGNAIFDERSGEDRLLAGTSTIEDRVQIDSQAIRLRLSPGAFLQANREVAGLAYGAIARALAVSPGERVVDAYSGVGGIALALARNAGEVIGIEAHPGAVDDAIASAALNGITNARFVAADAAPELAALDRADVVVLNPPRKGCTPAVLAAVARLHPRAIAYLSCDPTTLARDLAWLSQHGYRPRAITPFDMLPHTAHVESLALLEPRR